MAAATARPTAAPAWAGGSIILKAAVRFLFAAFAAYLAFLASADGGLGEFEMWLAVGAAFVVTLAISMFGPARTLVAQAAEALKWMLCAAAGLGVAWLLFNGFG